MAKAVLSETVVQQIVDLAAKVTTLETTLNSLVSSFDTLSSSYTALLADMKQRDLSNRVDKLEAAVSAIQTELG